MEEIKLNLGCGNRYRSGWMNIDFRSNCEDVFAHDLTQGIPVETNTAAVVYSSHLIEHFTKAEARQFLNECFRVLKPGGVIRVVFPDLEKIARDYLLLLDKARSGDEEAADNYDWVVINLLDQMARNVPGGEMSAYCIRESIPNENFVVNYNGAELLDLIKHGKELYMERKNGTAAVMGGG